MAPRDFKLECTDNVPAGEPPEEGKVRIDVLES
jgi:hypothetical protein